MGVEAVDAHRSRTWGTWRGGARGGGRGAGRWGAGARLCAALPAGGAGGSVGSGRAAARPPEPGAGNQEAPGVGRGAAGMAGPGWGPPRLDGFILTERLGSGTYATVYKAYAKVGAGQGAPGLLCAAGIRGTRTSKGPAAMPARP